MLRKIQYAPETDEPVEPVTRSQDFVMADKSLHLEATLEKDVSGREGVVGGDSRLTCSEFTSIAGVAMRRGLKSLPSYLLYVVRPGT